MNEERSVKALLGAVVIIWGLNVVMVKFLVDYFPPVILAAVRIGAATLLLAGIMIWKSGLQKVPAKTWPYIIGAGLSGIFIHQIALGIGLQSANASIGSLILGLNPLVTGVLAYFLFREPLAWNRVVGVILGFAGVFVVAAGDSLLKGSGELLQVGKGEAFIGVAMLTYVIGSLLVKKAAETVPVLTITTYMHVVGTVALAVTAVFEWENAGGMVWPSDWLVWTVLLFSGWVATGICAILWNNAIRKIGAGKTAMFLNGMPVASLVFAVLLLGETFTWIDTIGFATVFTGVLLGTMKQKSASLSTPAQTWVK